MQFTKDYCFTLHAFASNIDVILKNSIYCIIYQRGIAIDGGYMCGMYDGVPLMLPRSQRIKAYIEEVMSDVRGSINEKKMFKFMLYICVGKMDVVERWIFDLNLKEADEGTPCTCSAVPEMSDLALKITSIACCLPILKKKCRFYFVFEVGSRDSAKFDNNEDIETIIGNQSSQDYYVRSFSPDELH